MDQSTVFLAIRDERARQDAKWGDVEQHPHEVGAWLTILRGKLADAEKAWRSRCGDGPALAEVLKVVAVGVACLEQHGAGLDGDPAPAPAVAADPPVVTLLPGERIHWFTKGEWVKVIRQTPTDKFAVGAVVRVMNFAHGVATVCRGAVYADLWAYKIEPIPPQVVASWGDNPPLAI